MSQPSRCTLTAPRLARGRMADNEHAYRAASPLCTPVYKRWKNPKQSHLVSLFGTPGAPRGRQSSLGKSLGHHEIGPDGGSAGPLSSRVA